MKKHKKLKIWLLVILLLLVVGFSSYKVLYNKLAPVVFDMVVGRNPEAIFKLGELGKEEETSITLEKEEEETEKSEKSETKEDEEETKEEKKESAKSETYSTETYIGVLTTHDLAVVIKSISPADKTRIITICKSVVSASDMPRFARMATKGMKGDDYSFAEGYLRARLSPAQKKEIMEIVRKYLGR